MMHISYKIGGIQNCFGFGLSDVHVVKATILAPNDQFSFSTKIIKQTFGNKIMITFLVY